MTKQEFIEQWAPTVYAFTEKPLTEQFIEDLEKLLETEREEAYNDGYESFGWQNKPF